MSNEKMDKKNKAILISGISVVSLVLLATIVSAFIPRTAPEPKQLGSRAKITYMATKEFARLPEAEKKQYMSKLGRPQRGTFRNMSAKERQAVFKNTHKVMQKQMKERIKKFFAMSKDEQNALLDKIIAQHEKRRKEMEARRAANGNNNSGRSGGGPPRGGPSKAMMQNILENTDSTTRAQMSEFFRLMQERRKQNQRK